MSIARGEKSNFDNGIFLEPEHVTRKMCGTLRAGQWSPGSLVTVEKDLRRVTALSYIQTAFRPCDSESTQPMIERGSAPSVYSHPTPRSAVPPFLFRVSRTFLDPFTGAKV